jgi:hypothetical protein
MGTDSRKFPYYIMTDSEFEKKIEDFKEIMELDK